jgi:hypothetical protein
MDLGKPGITGNVKEISLSVEGDATAADRARRPITCFA